MGEHDTRAPAGASELDLDAIERAWDEGKRLAEMGQAQSERAKVITARLIFRMPALVAEVRRLRAAIEPLTLEVGRLHEQRTKLLGVIGDLVKLCPESAEAVFALTDIIMSGDPATERRDA